MPGRPGRPQETISPEDLMSALAEEGGPTLYLSRGYGPRPQLRSGEAPEYVRVALIPEAAYEEVQAAGERWSAATAELGPVAGPASDPAELASPAADSRWATSSAEARAAVLTRGIEELATLRPELAVFHLTAASIGPVLLPRVRASVTGEGPPLDLVVLDHVLYSVLTHRTLRYRQAARVVAPGATWSMRQVFPDHAPVWKQGLIAAPVQEVSGLAFAQLGELLVRALLARRAGTESPASAPAIAAALAAAEPRITPWISNLMGEGDRPPARN